MTGPQIPAVSRYTFDKCLPRTLAQPFIIGLWIICSCFRFSDASKRGQLSALLLITQTDYIRVIRTADFRKAGFIYCFASKKWRKLRE